MIEVKCPICAEPLRFSIATSRRSKRKKAFVMLVCPTDGRHFRGFISDQEWVGRLMEDAVDTKLASTGMGGGTGIPPNLT